ncbi:hypothetical protein MHBO_000938 [Bonamia ostreae]|uniref:Uncharacterized protein n=1 Tax=Bonamia ostreae TaxID=126728 RepID=A0ABV2AHC7_9EUKA
MSGKEDFAMKMCSKIKKHCDFNKNLHEILKLLLQIEKEIDQEVPAKLEEAWASKIMAKNSDELGIFDIGRKKSNLTKFISSFKSSVFLLKFIFALFGQF